MFIIQVRRGVSSKKEGRGLDWEDTNAALLGGLTRIYFLTWVVLSQLLALYVFAKSYFPTRFNFPGTNTHLMLNTEKKEEPTLGRYGNI